MSPNGKLFAVLGDHEDGCIVDPKCGKVSEWFFPSISLQGPGLYLYVVDPNIQHSHILCRQLVLLGVTWITHLHLLGILMAISWQLGVKTLHAGYGTSGTYRSR